MVAMKKSPHGKILPVKNTKSGITLAARGIEKAGTTCQYIQTVCGSIQCRTTQLGWASTPKSILIGELAL